MSLRASMSVSPRACSGTHVRRRADESTAGDAARLLQHLGDSEIGDVGVAFNVEEDVRRF